MGSTNKTANIGLSQFIGTDKPTWLVDYNNDMAVIDEAIGELQNDSGLIDTAIAELQTNVQNLQSGQGDSATEIAEVKSDVQTLSANYETMHHELVLNQNVIENMSESVDNLTETVDLFSTNYRMVYVSVTGDDSNSGLSSDKPMKTITGVVNKYNSNSYLKIQLITAGEYPVGINTIGTKNLFIIGSSNDCILVIDNALDLLCNTRVIKCTIRIDAQLKIFGDFILESNASLVLNKADLIICGTLRESGAPITGDKSIVLYAGTAILLRTIPEVDITNAGGVVYLNKEYAKTYSARDKGMRFDSE